MTTTIRRGEVYHFATMDPAVLHEVRDIEQAAEEAQAKQIDGAAQPPDHRLLGAFRRLFGRRSTH